MDWVLETNRLPVDQYVTYRTIEFDFEPGFRIGAGHEGDWDTKFYYTRFNTRTTDEATGNLTAAFLGGKEAQPPARLCTSTAGKSIRRSTTTCSTGTSASDSTRPRRSRCGPRGLAGRLDRSVVQLRVSSGVSGAVRPRAAERDRGDAEQFLGNRSEIGIENALVSVAWRRVRDQLRGEFLHAPTYWGIGP